jgi:hypothetical protein
LIWHFRAIHHQQKSALGRFFVGAKGMFGQTLAFFSDAFFGGQKLVFSDACFCLPEACLARGLCFFVCQSLFTVYFFIFHLQLFAMLLFSTFSLRRIPYSLF